MKQFKIADSKKVLEILNRVKFFNSFTFQEKKSLSQFHQYVASYEKGDFIIKEGEHDEIFYILLLGEVSVHLGTPPRQIATLETGDFFGEISFLTPAPRTANVISNTNTTVLAINKDMLNNLDIGIREKFKDKLIQRLAERLTQMNSFAVDIESQLPKVFMFPHFPTYVP